MDEFITSFNEADALIVTEIYAASEDKIEGVTGASLAEKIRSSGHRMFLRSLEGGSGGKDSGDCAERGCCRHARRRRHL